MFGESSDAYSWEYSNGILVVLEPIKDGRVESCSFAIPPCKSKYLLEKTCKTIAEMCHQHTLANAVVYTQ